MLRRNLTLMGLLLSGLLIITSTSAFTPAEGSRPVRTGFNPEIHGFQFVNTFKNDFIREFDVRTGGLCGGMTYAALDYYFKRKPIPRQRYRPAVNTTLHDYIYDRQVHSIADNVDKWAEVGFNPFGSRNGEFFEWGLRGYNGGRLQELRAKIDRGQPVPLGLQNYDSKGPGNHQVLAIGYDLGRYKGDLKNYKEDLKIFVYDPNYPGKTMTLIPDVRNQAYYYLEEGKHHRWRTYFVDMKYRTHTPPTAAAPVAARNDLVTELLLNIKTGGDDLRGGNDNLNVTIHFHGKPAQQVKNINGGRRWIDNYAQTVRIPLREPVTADQLASLVLTTTFGGGMGGDNWNMDILTVTACSRDGNKVLYNKASRPLFRFTGDRKTFTARLK